MTWLYLSELFLNTLKGRRDIKSVMSALQICDEELYRRIGYINDREALASSFLVPQISRIWNRENCIVNCQIFLVYLKNTNI